MLIGAHYDHIRGCDGADDNASGVAGVLEAARVLARASYPHTLVACWDEEERGLIGSRAYARRARANGDTIDAYFNFEMIGYSDSTANSQQLLAGFSLLFREAALEDTRNMHRDHFVAVIRRSRIERHRRQPRVLRRSHRPAFHPARHPRVTAHLAGHRRSAPL